MNRRRVAEVEQIPEFEAIQATAPKDLLMMGDMSMAVAHYIFQLLEEKQMTQRDLADAMGKTEAEVSKWLSGMHNLTLRSIAKLQLALGEAVLRVPHKMKHEQKSVLPEMTHVVSFQTEVQHLAKRHQFKNYMPVNFGQNGFRVKEQVA
jgi:transcriptional regulator with XRE-family HTH domain